jgi:hypothetical protein
MQQITGRVKRFFNHMASTRTTKGMIRSLEICTGSAAVKQMGCECPVHGCSFSNALFFVNSPDRSQQSLPEERD